MKILNTIAERIRQIINPVIEEINWFLICVIIFLGGAICYNYVYSATVLNGLIWTLVELPVYVVIASVFSIFYHYLKHHVIGRVICYIGLFVCAIVALVEIFLLLFFQTYITPSILTFLFQTNLTEAQGFLQAFIYNKYFVLFAVIVAVVIFVLGLLIMLFSNALKSSRLLRFGIIASFLCSLLIFTIPQIRIRIMGKYPFTAVTRMMSSLTDYRSILDKEGDICFDSKVLESTIESPIIVLIIGESFSKYHSSLYGYDKETNPLLSEYVSSSNLYLFNDVICPYNKTNKMLKELFSLHSVDSESEWSDYPLWPQIFKDAGYFVSFVSNQVSAVGDDHCEDMGAYFFQYPMVAKHCFDYRNTNTYQYDDGLLTELKLISESVQDSGELTILQLKGQHIYAKYNYPNESFSKFVVADYKSDMLDLDIKQLQELTDYDNATVYNDYVVSEIMDYYSEKDAIVIYLSDHGEEVYDYRPFLSRTHGTLRTDMEMKYQYEIPFMIYMSDLYKKRHPDIVECIETSLYKSFMSDDLAHMLVGVSGINTLWYDKTRDLLNEDYNCNRTRMIEDNQSYDKAVRP